MASLVALAALLWITYSLYIWTGARQVVSGSNSITILLALTLRHLPPPPYGFQVQGLVTRERGDSSTLESYKLPYCHTGPACNDLASAVRLLKPTVLVGLSTHGSPPFPFTPDVLQVGYNRELEREGHHCC